MKDLSFSVRSISSGPRPDPIPSEFAVIGVGRLGSALARALRAAGYNLSLVMGSSPDSATARTLASEIGCSPARSIDEILERAGVVFLCVPDARLTEVVDKLAAETQSVIYKGEVTRLIGHTAGSVGVSVLEPLASAGWEVFALHPAVSIADRNTLPEVLRNRYAALTASEGAKQTALEIARSIGLIPFELPEEARAAYHLSCAVASNFLVTLAALAGRIAADAGVGDPSALHLSLMQSTIDNLSKLRPDEALTGPIARGDVSTVAAHLEVLADSNPAMLDPYIALARATLELADISEEARREMLSLLGAWSEKPDARASLVEAV